MSRNIEILPSARAYIPAPTILAEQDSTTGHWTVAIEGRPSHQASIEGEALHLVGQSFHIVPWLIREDPLLAISLGIVAIPAIAGGAVLAAGFVAELGALPGRITHPMGPQHRVNTTTDRVNEPSPAIGIDRAPVRIPLSKIFMNRDELRRIGRDTIASQMQTPSAQARLTKVAGEGAGYGIYGRGNRVLILDNDGHVIYDDRGRIQCMNRFDGVYPMARYDQQPLDKLGEPIRFQTIPEHAETTLDVAEYRIRQLEDRSGAVLTDPERRKLINDVAVGIEERNEFNSYNSLLIAPPDPDMSRYVPVQPPQPPEAELS